MCMKRVWKVLFWISLVVGLLFLSEVAIELFYEFILDGGGGSEYFTYRFTIGTVGILLFVLAIAIDFKQGFLDEMLRKDKEEPYEAPYHYTKAKKEQKNDSNREETVQSDSTKDA